MQTQSTDRIYLTDDHCFEVGAVVLAINGNSLAVDRTCFYPGGGGQPADTGRVEWGAGQSLEIESVLSDEQGMLWHVCTSLPPRDLVGKSVRLILKKERRLALMRYHTVLHVLNTIMLKDYEGWITGVQINEEYSRIDFKLGDFSPGLISEIEQKVNLVLEGNYPLKAYYISENEFRGREDLLRTLVAKPPVVNGQVRVVEIEGFDAQACGGTHVHSTSDVGRFSIYKIDNKGKNNKRFYVKLDGGQVEQVIYNHK